MIVTYDDGFMRIYYFKLDNKSDDNLINVDINFIKFREQFTRWFGGHFTNV